MRERWCCTWAWCTLAVLTGDRYMEPCFIVVSSYPTLWTNSRNIHTSTLNRTLRVYENTTTITGTRIGSGRADKRRKSARNRKIVVDAVRETGETWMEREKNVEKKGLVQ